MGEAAHRMVREDKIKKYSYREGGLTGGKYIQDMIRGHTFGEMLRTVAES